MEKIGGKKSRGTIPLTLFKFFKQEKSYICILICTSTYVESFHATAPVINNFGDSSITLHHNYFLFINYLRDFFYKFTIDDNLLFLFRNLRSELFWKMNSWDAYFFSLRRYLKHISLRSLYTCP
jgi:hypothetical protein